MGGNASVAFFENQYQAQLRDRDLALNPFERLALEYLRGEVLDLGCGLGNLSLEAARRGHSVEAVDASPTAVAHIAAEAGRQGLPVRVRCEDLGTWTIEDRFDTVVSIGLLMFFPRQRALELLQQVQDAVRPGGRAALNVLVEGTTDRRMFDGDRFHLFHPAALLSRFDDWRILTYHHDDFEAPGGTRKAFLTLVAEKPSISRYHGSQ